MNSSNSPELVGKPFKFPNIAILSMAVSLLSILGIGSLAATFLFDWLPHEIEPIAFVIQLVGVVLLAILGVGLGIGSLVQKGNRRIFGILGFTLNGLILVAMCLFASFLFTSTLGPADGCVFGKAKTWTDQNGNGVWDTDEMPLAGVQFLVINNQEEYRYTDKSTSDESGEATLVTFPYTCNSLSRGSLVIQTTPPDGYRATTSDQVIILGDELPHILGRTYLFGFMRQASP